MSDACRGQGTVRCLACGCGSATVCDPAEIRRGLGHLGAKAHFNPCTPAVNRV